MSKKEKKQKEEKKEEITASNCFEGMSEIMSKCCSGEGGFDCSTMMEAMKGKSCCSPTTDKETKNRC